LSRLHDGFDDVCADLLPHLAASDGGEARNSSFTCKGRAADVALVGRELGVRYTLDDSVRTAGDRIKCDRAAGRGGDRQAYLGAAL